METGLILKTYREQNNFSQEMVASFLGIKRELLSYYENGNREASIEVLEKLADLYGAELGEFFETDQHQVQTNVAFAFRASELCDQDLKQLAEFRKVVKNYVKMTQLEKGDGK